jgi:hypothetical protein
MSSAYKRPLFLVYLGSFLALDLFNSRMCVYKTRIKPNGTVKKCANVTEFIHFSDYVLRTAARPLSLYPIPTYVGPLRTNYVSGLKIGPDFPHLRFYSLLKTAAGEFPPPPQPRRKRLIRSYYTAHCIIASF